MSSQHRSFSLASFAPRQINIQFGPDNILFVFILLLLYEKFSILICNSADALGRYMCRVTTNHTKHTLNFIEPDACLLLYKTFSIWQVATHRTGFGYHLRMCLVWMRMIFTLLQSLTVRMAYNKPKGYCYGRKMLLKIETLKRTTSTLLRFIRCRRHKCVDLFSAQRIGKNHNNCSLSNLCK